MFNKLLIYVVLTLLGVIIGFSFYNFYLKTKLNKSEAENQNFEVRIRTKVVEANATSIASKAVGEIHQIEKRKKSEKPVSVGTHTKTF